MAPRVTNQMVTVNTTCSLFKAFVPFILLTTCLPFVYCGNDLMSKFLSGYDKATRPGFAEEKATIILTDLEIESFGNIEEANMEYKVFGYFRQYWTDMRLAGKLNRTFVTKGSDIERFWVPDPYCYNARESNMMIPNAEVHSSLTIHPNGSILYGRGVTLLGSCIMDLRAFPLDSQSCFLKFGSYSYTIKDIVFKWKTKNLIVGNEEMAQFLFKGTELTSTTNVYATGNFSTLTATFSFERRIGYYLIQVYFPDIFVVTLSWIVFWMNKTDMGDRMALGITTILTIMFLLGSLNGTLPKVSYPKALDWYLLVSFSFVFLSLMECMAVFIFTQCANSDKEIKCKVNNVSLYKRISKSIRSAFNNGKEKKSPTDDTGGNGMLNLGSDHELEMVVRTSKANKAVMDDGELEDFGERNRNEKIADRIDQLSRILFPLAFLIYNIFYWAYY